MKMLVLIALGTVNLMCSTSAAERILFNEGWQFTKDDTVIEAAVKLVDYTVERKK